MLKNNRKLLFGIIIVFVLLASIGFTYAYFTVVLTVDGNINDEIVTTGTLQIQFNDGPEISELRAIPDTYIGKLFKVTNTGTLDATYNLNWKSLKNEILNDEIELYVYCYEYEEFYGYDPETGSDLDSNIYIGSCGKIEGEPIGTNKNESIMYNTEIPSGLIHVYQFIVHFIETNADQNYNQGKTFGAELEVVAGYDELNLRGKLVDNNGTPISNATVTLGPSNYVVSSNHNGLFLFNGIDYGTHSVIIKDSSDNILANDTINITKSTLSSVSEDGNIMWQNDQDFNTVVFKVNNEGIDNSLEIKYAPESCFEFNATTNTIVTYYEHENNNQHNEACPKNVAIPEEINGVDVLNIGASAFSKYNREELFTEDMTSYGLGITTVRFPSKLQNISESAFMYNEILDLYVPSNVKNIDALAFSENSIKNLTLADGVETIGDSAFASNNIRYIKLSNVMNSINNRAFASNEIINLTIPNNITSIGEFAFAYNSITKLEIPTTVNNIGYAAFNDNLLTNIEAFIYKRNVDGSIDNSTVVSYAGREKVNVVVPKSVTTIDKYAFASNEIYNITLQNELINIREFAFWANKLSSVTIKNNVSVIERGAFSNNMLEEVIIIGKDSSSDFTTYDSDIWGWAEDLTCTENNTSNLELPEVGCIEWN